MAIKSTTAALCCVAAVLVLAVGGADGLSCNTGFAWNEGGGVKWIDGYPLKQVSSASYAACWSVYMTGTKLGYFGALQLQYLTFSNATTTCTEANRATFAAGSNAILNEAVKGTGIGFSAPYSTCCTTDNCNEVTLAASLLRPTPLLLLLALLGMLCLKQLV